MKATLILFFSILLFSGCDLREREEKLQQEQEQLVQKELALLSKEKELQIREQELVKREQKLDSTIQGVPKDTGIYKAALVGLWTVKMNCTETDCPGSAVGDTKTEQWDISYQNHTVIAKALVDEKLVRIYSGLYTGNSLELTAQQIDTASQNSAQIVVRLEETEGGNLEGRREITRASNCKTIYAVNMVKP